jgi:acetyltransferase-like isoleucine patch superfamily enzyme
LADTARAARSRARAWAVVHRTHLRGQRVEWGRDVRVAGKLVIRGPGAVVIGDRCQIRRAGTATILETLAPDAVIHLGSGCLLTGTAITARLGVRVGAGGLLGEAWIVDTDFHSVQRNRRDPSVAADAVAVKLGTNVWVATSAMVLKGVTIGDNSVVGAHTVVRQPVPPDVIVIGNPQQVVGRLDPNIEPFWR